MSFAFVIRIFAFLATALIASPAAAQTSTNCQQYGTRTRCQTTGDQTQQTQQQDRAAANLGSALGAALASRHKKRDNDEVVSPLPPVDTSSGNGYLRMCEVIDGPEGNSLRFGICYGYIDGFLERDRTVDVGHAICLPSNVDNKQLMDVALSYLRAHPELRHQVLGGLMFGAFYAAFPCQPAK